MVKSKIKQTMDMQAVQVFREGDWDLHQCVNMEHIINYAPGPVFAAEPIYLTFFGIEKFFVPRPLFLWISSQQK